MPAFDVAVVGGGIIGVATARLLLQRFPRLAVVLLEKEKELAAHQTGHNSGVIHSGVYYKPGSLKAKLCLRGNAMIYEYCATHGIRTLPCGKLIVAVEPAEIPRLRQLFERGVANGVPNITWINDAAGVRDHEPHCTGLAAIHCPSTGLVDYTQVTHALAAEFTALGGTIQYESWVERVVPADDARKFRLDLRAPTAHVAAKHVITCAGLHSDRVAGASHRLQIMPVRGEYLRLKSHKRHLVRGNIYPAPNPAVPFLGVHFTPRLNGDLWLGPNAVFALAREGYKYSDLSWQDMKEKLAFPGFWRLAQRHAAFGVKELYLSLRVKAQMTRLQRYIPEITAEDIEPGPSGVRAQAVGRDGALVEDFVLEDGPGPDGHNVLHVVNAPSPGATSSLAIAEMLVDRAASQFKLA